MYYFLAVIILIILLAYVTDKTQRQHAILRNYPIIGRIRYLAELSSDKVRDYYTEGEIIVKSDYQNLVKMGKYQNTIIPFGSKRNFDAPGYYIANPILTKQKSELKVDNNNLVTLKKYRIDKEGSMRLRKEHMEEVQSNPWLFTDDDTIIIGENCKYPFKVKGPIGMSAMSYGALGDHAISALSIGIGLATGSWMNTGEGGISHHHLKGDVDIISQISSGLFGYRDKNGNFSWEELKAKAQNPKIKAFELKLAQGAKIRGGHVNGSKITEEIAEIRGVEPFKTIDSPNRFHEFNDLSSMLDFIEKIRKTTEKPVGIKIVVGDKASVEEMINVMSEKEIYPDFITVDGGEGGTGATFKSMADSVGLPLKSGLMILDNLLNKYNLRNHIKVIASGGLYSADRIAIALGMGADLVQVARAFMIQVGCIRAQVCHTNKCPVGVATTDPKLQKALVVDEKKYRVANYIVTLREELYTLAASCGLTSPKQFSQEHIVYKDGIGRILSLKEIKESM